MYCKSEPAREKNAGIRMMPEKGYSNLRKGRVSEVGRAYHLTFSTLSREPVFSDFSLARQLIALMHEPAMQTRVECLSFVVMPDHVHWLFVLRDGSLSEVVQRLKSFFTKIVGRNIWNRGFHDHAIRSDESLVKVARYIVANPLRAGLVNRVGDYPHWDAAWLDDG